MAIQPGNVSITFTFIDDDLATSSHSVSLPGVTDMADAEEFATDYSALLSPASDCAMTKYTISQEYYDDTYPTASAGSDVEDKGVMKYRTAQNGVSTVTVPGIKESLLISTGTTRKGVWLDTADAIVSALVSALTTGLATTSGTTQPSNTRGMDLIGLIDAYKQNRGSQKSMGNKG